jgi:hypothetical protein
MKRLMVVFLILLSQGMLSGFISSAQSSGEPLQVTVKLEAEPYLRSQPVVYFSVRNVSDRKQEFWIMSCSYEENWKTDHPVVKVLRITECDKNLPLPKYLEPGESYDGELTLHFEKGEEGAEHAFRLGFCPYIRGFSRKVSHVYWSNKLKVVS